MKIQKGFKQFILKTILFVALFILISFVIGQKIVSSNLLYEFKLFIYGGMGYVLLFSITGFILMYKEKISEFREHKNNFSDFSILFLSFFLVFCFYYFAINIKSIEITLLNIFLIHFLFLFMLVSLLFGVFGKSFIINFLKIFKKELIYFLLFGIIVYSLMYQVWKLWPYLSLIVLNITSFLLKIISSNTYVIKPNLLVFEGFSAKIAEACSGIYSIFIFTSMYLFIIFLDWKKINKKRAIILLIPSIIGAFLMNILRVFLLFIFGAYVSREIALGLYHSYVGMIFFILYFTLFWGFAYKWLVTQKKDLNT